MKIYKCENGYPVGTAYDAHPELCKIDYTKGENVKLYESTDSGKNWSLVGYFEWLDRFDSLSNSPSWLKDEAKPIIEDFLNTYLEIKPDEH